MERFEDAFEPLFARSYRSAARILGDAAEAEDVAAEAMTRAYLAWRRLGDVEHRQAWVLRVTTNLAIDVLRRRYRALPAPTVSDGGTRLAELRAVLAPLLLALPRRQRQVVALRHLVDLPEAEVARIMGISPGAVKQHLHRALSSLRTALPPELTS